MRRGQAVGSGRKGAGQPWGGEDRSTAVYSTIYNILYIHLYTHGILRYTEFIYNTISVILLTVVKKKLWSGASYGKCNKFYKWERKNCWLQNEDKKSLNVWIPVFSTI